MMMLLLLLFLFLLPLLFCKLFVDFAPLVWDFLMLKSLELKVDIVLAEDTDEMVVLDGKRMWLLLDFFGGGVGIEWNVVCWKLFCDGDLLAVLLLFVEEVVFVCRFSVEDCAVAVQYCSCSAICSASLLCNECWSW